METYNIEIAVNGNYAEVQFSDNTPCLLADQIKIIVENFFMD